MSDAGCHFGTQTRISQESKTLCNTMSHCFNVVNGCDAVKLIAD